MQANGSRPRGLTVLVPFCVGIWGSVGQSHPTPVPCQMLARTSGGAAAPKSKGKGTREGGASTPKRAGEETPPAAAWAQWGRRSGRLPVRPCRNPKGRENFREGFFFFFFFGIFLLFMSLPFAGHWEMSSPDSGSSGCGYQYVFLATPQRVS